MAPGFPIASSRSMQTWEKKMQRHEIRDYDRVKGVAKTRRPDPS
jgi:hypothetical protein